MGPFSKKPDEQAASSDAPVSNVSNDTSTQPVDTTPAVAPAQPVKKHSKALSFVSILFLLMLLAAGVMTYLWYDQKSQVDSLRADVEAAEKTAADLRENATKVDNPDEPVAVEMTDDDQIKEATITYQHTFKATEKTQYAVTITKKEAEFARVSFAPIPSEGGGAACLLKKVDGTWLVLFCGQSTPEQSELDKWGVPKTFMTGA